MKPTKGFVETTLAICCFRVYTSMEMRPSSFVFTVERSEPELIAPAKSTPYEFKFLSDLDSQIREQGSSIHFFRNSEAAQGRDAVKVIKEAIAETLVHYYPLAGRILEGPKGKLIVECTGEGILFIEANANVRLDEFGFLLPPFPGVHDLLYDVPGSSAILHCPLLLIQVINKFPVPTAAYIFLVS